MTQIGPISSAEHTAPADSDSRDAGTHWQAQPPAALVRLLQSISAIWICYILVLSVVDRYFAAINPDVRPLPALYYISQVLIAGAVLGLSFSHRVQLRLGRSFLPLVLIGMSALPLITTSLTIPSSLPGPIAGTGGLVRLRALPILTVAVVLIAWQYHWKHVVLFSVGTTALVIVLLIGQPVGFLNMLAITAVQMMSFLIVGYSTCALMDKLRAQRMALEQANRQLRHYATTLEKLAISRERNRVARELHDTLAHTLSGLTVQLEATKAYWDVDPQAARAMVETALESTRDGLHETRRALKALRASPLEDLGLRVALCSMAAHTAEGANLRLDCAVAENLPVLSADVEQCIYRIAQEAVTNAAHYADADRLTIKLSCSDGGLTLMVQDNGHGFDAQRDAAPGHFGISGMYERAALAGGTLSIASVPGEGTTVYFHLGSGA